MVSSKKTFVSTMQNLGGREMLAEDYHVHAVRMGTVRRSIDCDAPFSYRKYCPGVERPLHVWIPPSQRDARTLKSPTRPSSAASFRSSSQSPSRAGSPPPSRPSSHTRPFLDMNNEPTSSMRSRPMSAMTPSEYGRQSSLKGRSRAASIPLKDKASELESGSGSDVPSVDSEFWMTSEQILKQVMSGPDRNASPDRQEPHASETPTHTETNIEDRAFSPSPRLSNRNRIHSGTNTEPDSVPLQSESRSSHHSTTQTSSSRPILQIPLDRRSPTRSTRDASTDNRPWLNDERYEKYQLSNSDKDVVNDFITMLIQSESGSASCNPKESAPRYPKMLRRPTQVTKRQGHQHRNKDQIVDIVELLVRTAEKLGVQNERDRLFDEAIADCLQDA